MIKVIGLVLVFLLSTFAMAQPDKAEVETVGGKKYYVHFVEQGQTLYGIHQLYQVSVDEISSANNGLTDGLQIGQKILIPISLEDTNFYKEHIIAQGETLYGISKSYKCSVSDLKNLNPELSSGELQIGQKIKVPGRSKNIAAVPMGNDQSVEKIIDDPVDYNVGDTIKVVYTDSIITHTVLKHETLYAISKRYMVSIQSINSLNDIKKNKVKEGDQLKIKVKNVNYEIVENNLYEDTLQLDSSLISSQIVKKDKYKVALFLPLMLSKNETYLNKPIRVGEERELYPVTKIAADFYHGFLLAADSLTQAGLTVELYVYDTKKDTNTIIGHLKKPEFNDMDLVVGPFYPKSIDVLADYCAKNSVPMVIPFNSGTKVLYQNPYVFKATSSNLTLVNGMMDFVVENYSGYNISIIKPTAASDLMLFEQAREKFNSNISSQPGAMNSKIIELTLGNANGRDINVKLRKDTVNVVVVPSTNLKFVSGVFTRLNNVLNLNPYAKNMKIIVFGLEDWNKYDDLDLKHRMRLNQHYASYRYVDYEADKTSKMISSFRAKYGTDPDVYGIQGFDIGYYFMSAMYLYGENYENYIENYELDLVQNEFYFPRINELDGRENQSVKVVEYSDYKLILK